ncbi:hypothetical protein Peur_063046 [Populus x canadensis]
MTNKKVSLLFGRRTQRPKTKALSFKSQLHIISSNTKPVFFITDFSYHSKTTRWNSDPYNVIQVDTGTVG